MQETFLQLKKQYFIKCQDHHRGVYLAIDKMLNLSSDNLSIHRITETRQKPWRIHVKIMGNTKYCHQNTSARSSLDVSQMID